MAGARGTDYTREPSAWVVRLVKRARRNRCPHWPGEGSDLVLLPAHAEQLLCKACAGRAAKALPGSLDGPRCDVCRAVAPLEVFGFHLRTLLVTGRSCAGCEATVYGEAS